MAGHHEINVTVVVSGARLSVTGHADQKVEHLIREALREAGIPHPKVKDWTLRFANGGAAIDPDLHIGSAGITDGAILFLDPDEGGGGEAVVTPAPSESPKPPPVLVDPAISVAKLDSQLEDWEANADIYRERGWHLLGREGLLVDIAFTARLPVGPFSDLVAIPLAVQFGFENYDVWAPSIRVIDPLTRRWLDFPRVRALDFSGTGQAGAPLDLFVNGHPETGKVFLCKAGSREYHTHFEHSGDDWLLYRDQGFGTLGRLCDLIWRAAVRSVTGLNFAAQRLPLGDAAHVNLAIEIRQEDVDQLRASLEPQMPKQIPIDQLPPQMLAQLPPNIQALVAQNQ
jgi:Predicted metal binding domain/WXG100 protein secretion system (Wss), protein YukD